MLALAQIIETHKLPLIGPTSGLNGLFYGPWWYYLLLPSFLTFFGNPSGVIFFMCLTGMETVYFSYVLAKKISGTFAALLFASLISVSPVMVSLSSQIWSPNLAPFFIGVFLLFLYVIFFNVKEKQSIRKRDAFFVGLLLSLLLDSEIVFGVLFSVGTVLSLLFIGKKQIKVMHGMWFSLGFIFILLPRIIFEFRHDFLMTKTVIGYIFQWPSAHTNSSFFSQIYSRAMTLETLWAETIAFNNHFFALFLLTLIVFSFVYFYRKANYMEKSFLQVGVCILGTFFIGLLAFPGDVWTHYLVGLPLMYLLLLMISLTFIWRYGGKLKNFSLVMACILVIVNLNPIRILEDINKPAWEGDASLYRNQLTVVDYVYKQAGGKPFKYIVYTPPVHDYTYKYLFSWYGKSKYGYMPNEKNQGMFFVILESDLQYPERLTDWLEDREKDGRIVKTQKFSGDIIVQTRKFK